MQISLTKDIKTTGSCFIIVFQNVIARNLTHKKFHYVDNYDAEFETSDLRAECICVKKNSKQLNMNCFSCLIAPKTIPILLILSLKCT